MCSPLLLFNGLKIVFILHPLPTLPPQWGGSNYIPSPLEGEGEGKGEGDYLYYYKTVLPGTRIMYTGESYSPSRV